MYTKAFSTLSGVATLLALAPLGLHAQLKQPSAVGSPTLQMSVGRPFIKEGELGFATSALSLRGLLPVSPIATLFADVGMAHATAASETSTAISNLRIGLSAGRSDKTNAYVAVTVPTSVEWGEDDFAFAVGALTDLERTEGYFVDDGLAVEAAIVAPLAVSASGVTLGARAGASVMKCCSGSFSTWETTGKYGLFVSAPAGVARLGAELSGRAALTQEGNLGERTFHMLAVTAALPARITPELFVQIPLDREIRESMRAVVGIRIEL